MPFISGLGTASARLADSSAGTTTSPAGMVTPPTVTGAVATSGIATCNGPS